MSGYIKAEPNTRAVEMDGGLYDAETNSLYSILDDNDDNIRTGYGMEGIETYRAKGFGLYNSMTETNYYELR